MIGGSEDSHLVAVDGVTAEEMLHLVCSLLVEEAGSIGNGTCMCAEC